MQILGFDIFSNQSTLAIGIIVLTTLGLVFYKYKKRNQRRLTPVQKKAFELLGKGSIEEFKKHVEEFQITPNLQDFSNLYLLHTAVGLCIKKEKEGLEAIEYLINKGANINCQDQSCRTPLLMASHWSLRSVVNLLCSYSADLNETIYKSGYPNNSLYTVLLKQSYKMAWFLIQKGASLENIEEIHNKTKKFKLSQAQLDFIEKCKLTLQRIETKKKVVRAKLYQVEYLKRLQKENKSTDNQSAEDQPSTFLSRLNHYELNEVCKRL